MNIFIKIVKLEAWKDENKLSYSYKFVSRACPSFLFKLVTLWAHFFSLRISPNITRKNRNVHDYDGLLDRIANYGSERSKEDNTPIDLTFLITCDSVAPLLNELYLSFNDNYFIFMFTYMLEIVTCYSRDYVIF